MTPDEAAVVLAKAASYDNRKPSAEMATSWAQALSDIDVRSALQAVIAHYAADTSFVMPAHVRNRARPESDARPYNRTVHEALDHDGPRETCRLCARRRALGTGEAA